MALRAEPVPMPEKGVTFKHSEGPIMPTTLYVLTETNRGNQPVMRLP